ncbi:MAG: DUF6179 domain-containing protein [Oscillospiraceae bacterium]
MNSIDILHPIDENCIDEKNYFESLTEQASICGLLTEEDTVRIQAELLAILAEQTEKWNKGESSSIRIEKAQDILASVIFVIGLQLKNYSSPENAVKALKSEPLKSVFENGLKRVRRKAELARNLQRRISNNLLDTPNVYYKSTVIDGINGFFKLYRPQFSAHEIYITADYPAYLGRPRLDGIEFIEQYLRFIEAENAFCICFDRQAIHRLLCGLTRDYRSIPMNLFEPVLLSALGLILTGRRPEGLDLQRQDIDALYRIFKNKASGDIHTKLAEASEILANILDIPNQTKNYIALCLPKMSETVWNAVLTETLDQVFLIPACPESEPSLTFSFGDRMNDREYCRLVKNIMQAPSSEEKINLILNQVLSLADLLDIMSDAELEIADFKRLVRAMPLFELAVLSKQYPNDDFLNRESEKMLYAALQDRKNALTLMQKEQLDRLIKALK